MGGNESYLIPSIVTTLFGGVLFFLIRKMLNDQKIYIDNKLLEIQKAMESKVIKIEDRIERIADSLYAEYVTEKEHGLICSNNSLQMEKLFKTCLLKLKDELFESLRKTREESLLVIKESIKEVYNEMHHKIERS